jgi:hypothetical protein
MSQQSAKPLVTLVGEANALLFENAESIPNGLYLQLMNLTGVIYSKVTKAEEENAFQKLQLQINQNTIAFQQNQIVTLTQQLHAAQLPAPAPAPAVVQSNTKKQKRICKRCADCGDRLTANDIAASWNEESRQEWRNNTDYNYRYIYIVWYCGSCI